MEQSTTTAFDGAIAHLSDIDLVPIDIGDYPPEEEVGFRIEGDPEIAARVLWVSDDRRQAIGVERCGPGKIIGIHNNESHYFVQGRVTATRPDGSQYEITAGDYVAYGEGQHEEWEVHETYIKCFNMRSSKPLPFELTP